MKHYDVFGNAVWVKANTGRVSPIIRTSFVLPEKKILSASINILGLGTYVFYVNGRLGSEDLFQPLNSNFEDRNHPSNEEMAVRAYVNNYDIKDFLKPGKNTVATMLGNGWYDGTRLEKAYGERKLCFNITVKTEDETLTFGTSLKDKYAESFVRDSNILEYEMHDYTEWNEELLGESFDDSALPCVSPAAPLETEYFFSDCPRDTVIEEYAPKVVKLWYNNVVYDVGMNTTGIPVLISSGEPGLVTVEFSEELTPNGEPDLSQSLNQRFTALVSDKPVEIKNVFSWYGFRYFKVTGHIKEVRFLRTHTKVDITSSFKSDNETLNWIYNTYVNTQRSNMHHGMPSDCPHFERRGYTGDGQLTCRSAMHVLDMHKFYTKWMEDISDCQDRLTGHVQYTAPYTKSGGGPGGWGSAIVVLPYEMWKYYGDDKNLERFYPQMLHYFEYLESHSTNKLVTSDTPGEWCLGEWCTPGPVELPAPFVNNYFYIKALEKVIEIAHHIGRDEDIPELERRIAERRQATEAAYFNPWDGNFVGGRQGANAFALDMGIGNEMTKKQFIEYYDTLGYYDTGIFGTDIVTRLLFEYGRADIAVKLLTAAEPHGFGKWMKDGATSYWEYWFDSRSHHHPMFGAVNTYLFEYLLGIKQDKDSYGFERVTVSPAYVDFIENLSGHITTGRGVISVKIETKEGKRTLEVSAPAFKDMQIAVVSPEGKTKYFEYGMTAMYL